MSFLEAIKVYCLSRSLSKGALTVRGEEQDLRLLCLYLRNKHIESIKEEEVIGYLQMMLDLGWTANGAYKKSCVFRNFWRFANQKGWKVFNADLIPIVKKPANIPNVGKPEHYKKLMEVAKGTGYNRIRDRAIMSLLWHTGARVGEICALNVKDLDLKNKRALIKTEKSRGQRPIREIFWDDPENEAHKHLLAWLEERKRIIEENHIEEAEALFFSRPRAQQWRRMSIYAVGINFREYSKKAKIPPFSPHQCRHHFAHDIVKQGGSNSDIMNLLGHSRLESSRIYTLMFGEELHERYRRYKGIGKS